jgi:hypothetical protein
MQQPATARQSSTVRQPCPKESKLVKFFSPALPHLSQQTPSLNTRSLPLPLHHHTTHSPKGTLSLTHKTPEGPYSELGNLATRQPGNPATASTRQPAKRPSMPPTSNCCLFLNPIKWKRRDRHFHVYITSIAYISPSYFISFHFISLPLSLNLSLSRCLSLSFSLSLYLSLSL